MTKEELKEKLKKLKEVSGIIEKEIKMLMAYTHRLYLAMFYSKTPEEYLQILLKPPPDVSEEEWIRYVEEAEKAWERFQRERTKHHVRRYVV